MRGGQTGPRPGSGAVWLLSSCPSLPSGIVAPFCQIFQYFKRNQKPKFPGQSQSCSNLRNSKIVLNLKNYYNVVHLQKQVQVWVEEALAACERDRVWAAPGAAWAPRRQPCSSPGSWKPFSSAPSCPSGTSFSFFVTLAFLSLHRGVKPVLFSQVSHLF